MQDLKAVPVPQALGPRGMAVTLGEGEKSFRTYPELAQRLGAKAAKDEEGGMAEDRERWKGGVRPVRALKGQGYDHEAWGIT